MADFKLAFDPREEIRERLSRGPRRRCPDGDYSAEAAVLIPFFQRDGQLYFLLTQRTEHVATHKGQISFPGGLREREDANLLQTALRETEEEIGTPAGCVEVLGHFGEYVSVTGLLVTPFVGFLEEGFPLSPSATEVERVLEVPYRFFSKTVPREEIRRRAGRDETLYFYQYRGDLIWGLTGRMIKDLVEFLRL